MLKKQLFLFLVILTILLSLNIIFANDTSHNITKLDSQNNITNNIHSNIIDKINKENYTYNSSNEVKENSKTNIRVDASDVKAFSSQNISLKYNVYSEDNSKVNIRNAILKINDRTVSKTNVTEGIVNFNFIVPSLNEGNHTITIKTGETNIYQQSVINKTLSIYRRNITITTNNFTSFAGKNNILKVCVKTTDNNMNVNISKIIIKISGKTVSSSSVVNGIAMFNFTTPDLRNGTYDMILKTGDTTLYNHAEFLGKFRVNRQNLLISSHDLTSYAGQKISLTTNIQTKGYKNITNIPILLKINNSTIISTKINNSNIKFDFITPYLKKGDYPILIKIGESTFYNSAEITKKLTIYAKNITITSNNLTGYAGKNLSFVVKFTSGYENVNISNSVIKLNEATITNQKVINGVATYSFIVPKLKEGNYSLTIKTGDTVLYNNATKNIRFTIKNPLKSNIFAESVQSVPTKNIQLQVNITDELNNTVNEGNLNFYLNNKKIDVTKTSYNTFSIQKQNIGIYDIKIEYTSNKYESAEKNIKLTVNPISNYNIKLVYNPSLFSGEKPKIRALVKNNSKNTVNKGNVKFYLNNKYLGWSDTKNNLSSLRINITENEGYYPVKVEYYLNNNFICADSRYLYIHKKIEQKEQNVYITLAGDLISNSKTNSNKKDVYFVMDRTTATYNYSPNDMKIMNTIAYTLISEGFNVKTIKNGPGETYNVALNMYNKNVKNSICFILCNGVDANVIREYLKGYDNRLTTVRNRGNDIVMGWFYGAGNIYDTDGEYYYWLNKAWDDNYSKWGGMSYPRKTAEKDGIKIIYQKDDLIGNKIASLFLKLYGSKYTEKVEKNSLLSLKTNIYTTNNKKINGNLIYTINGKIIKNMTTTSNLNTLYYKMPDVAGTYNIKVTYYSNNKPVCTTYDRYIKVY